jgi:hypothetical protein
MSDFIKARKELADSRTSFQQENQDLFGVDQRIKLLENELANLDRQQGDNNPEFTARVAEVRRKVAGEKEKRNQVLDRINGTKRKLAEAERLFETFVDPRLELPQSFSAKTPFLLFPMRIETRFKTVDGQRQLWVRVYPDECMVDGFEPLLSKKEVNNATRFWAEFYSAGDHPDPVNPDPSVTSLQKAAWKLLVGAHGDGRAAWITRQLVPDAQSKFPVRQPGTHILSIVAEEWNVTSEAAITGLFEDLWLADGNVTQSEQIKTTFTAANPTLNLDAILEKYFPVNFYDKPEEGLKREDAQIKFAIVVFPDLETKANKINSWTQPSKVNILPERLSLIRVKNGIPQAPIFGNKIPYPLHTSPDPADSEEQFKQDENKDMVFADSIKWLADFQRAVDIGMGFRITLAPDELDGFEKLLVLGVKLAADETAGQLQIEELLDHHTFSKKGLSLIPQGTPTNNTESANAGHSNSDFADLSFNQYFLQKAGFTVENNPLLRRDGQWIAEWLGLKYDVFQKVLHSGGLDQSDARSMNITLWPATLGYVMESVMESGFSPQTISNAREFFTRFVSGRGPIPAIRIGNQPYGIFATTAFSRQTWFVQSRFVERSEVSFIQKLYSILLEVDKFFTDELLASVSTVTKPSPKPGQTLLDVLSLHANSSEFFRRYLESLDEVSNAVKFLDPSVSYPPSSEIPAVKMLQQKFGYAAVQVPLLATLLGLPSPVPVKHLIDDVPLSETMQIRAYTGDKKNYISALATQARKSHDAVRTGEGLTERPNAELYRLLKYALEQSYHSTGVDLAANANAFEPQQLVELKVEKPFIHQEWKGNVTESKYAFLNQSLPQLSNTLTVADLVRDSIVAVNIPPVSRYLADQLAAMDRLADASTARLERAMVEHVDTCSYRLDSWKGGIIASHLTSLRNNHADVSDNQRSTGIFIGAFGWLENVRPERNKVLAQKEIPQELVSEFNKDGSKTFYTDAANEGFIHAPSLNQAVTAAVLRNGYISHGKDLNNGVLAVNLTSSRIRVALSLIEGIQAGQSLAALLGYQFERELHDRDDLKIKKIDTYIYKMRRAFPLAAEQLRETATAEDPSVDPEQIPITALEARNVVHGIKLINHVRGATDKTYPFGLSLTNDDPLIAAAITAAVKNISEAADALADLGIAESVHHIVMGNQDRAAGVLESYSKGNYPQTPDFIKTPRSGPTLTHRVGISFNYIPTAPTTAAPRVQGEPSLSQWLDAILPLPNKIVASVGFRARSNGGVRNEEVTMHQLGLTLIDLVYMVEATSTGQLDEIDERIIHHVHQTWDPQRDVDIKVNYTAPPVNADSFSLFQITPLIKSIKALVLQSPNLTPGDMSMPNETVEKEIPDPEIATQRVENVKNQLKAFLTASKANTEIVGYLSNLPSKETVTPAQEQTIINDVDSTLQRFAIFLLTLAKYGIAQTRSGQLYIDAHKIFTSLKKKLADFDTRWQANSDRYDELSAEPQTPEIQKQMERLITATAGVPGSGTLANKKIQFDAAFAALKNTLAARQANLNQLITAIKALSTTPFDLTPLDLEPDFKQIVLMVYDMKARAAEIVAALETKVIVEVEKKLTEIPTLSPDDKVKQLGEAAQLILGDAFKMIPSYPLDAGQQAEVSNAWNASPAILNYAKTTLGKTNPVDDWLHGIARVHEKMKHLENCFLMRQAFELPESNLVMHPVQLPYKTVDYHWLALPYPTDKVDLEKSNTLLYTAIIVQGDPPPSRVCGILADEWIEVIPAKEETTGIAFHYDRPNCEAPQTLLLVTSPRSSTEAWQWDDLVDSLLYTLKAARMRAIEPDLIDKTPFASLLPAVIAAESLHPFSIVLDNPVHYMAIQDINS